MTERPLRDPRGDDVWGQAAGEVAGEHEVHAGHEGYDAHEVDYSGAGGYAHEGPDVHEGEYAHAGNDAHEGEYAYEHEYEHDGVEEGHGGYHDPDAAAFGFAEDSRRARRERRNTGRGVRRFLILFVALGLIAGAGFLGFTALRPLFDRSADASDFAGPGGAAARFTVNDGDTGRAIGSNLQTQGIVLTAKAFVDACSADSRCAGIQPGDYALKKEMKAADALAILVDPKNRQNPKVTVREGLWASEIYALLGKATKHSVADYEAAAKSPDVLALLPPSAGGNVEGYLFPATYEFSDKDSAVTQLTAMVGKTVKVLTDLQIQPDQAERIMIIASIVEAEAKRSEDRAKVARVVLNRLAKPMRLQMDSTVSYGVKKRAITTTDEERASINGWNTYTKDGLPDSPIANPGLASIQAAVAPAEGPWLFFVAVNPETGETKFAATQAEHDTYVAQFQAWCNAAENQGKCSR
ncbi:MAG TPA: endolytic transglycosylase MltG [Dermatophilaceae bacterium]|jgi:UPF0755 protein|nr:MAG: putative aminodeoxychorismate lyase [bacterium ADurb.BinA028]HOF35426.1 endolytic transglycosylase MltG [Dermatophilaceae bacterium]HPK88584.1 endolytic transglycosylase MltG [Dermatophilaceae bacterium]